MNYGGTVLITGGTGMIGTALSKELIAKGYDVIILTRYPERYRSANPKLRYAIWDIKNQWIDPTAISHSNYIIHLAGAGIADKRWTKKRKKELVESRIQSSRLLIRSLKEIDNNVKAVISISAIGWYGPDHENNDKGFMETDPVNNDFLGQTCQKWEESIEPVAFVLNLRLIKLRTGIVFSNEGGYFPEIKKPLRFGLATIFSSGKQVVSWIHIDDLVRIFLFSLENQKIEGVFNAVAPHPVSNKELILEVAKKIRGKYFIPVHIPSFILKLVLGEMSIELLKSTKASSEKIHNSGFVFLYPTIEAAIRQLAGA